VRAAATARTGEYRTGGRRLANRSPAESRKAGKRAIREQAHAVDFLLARPHEERGGGAHCRVVERPYQLLQEVRPRLGIVVEQHDDLAGPGRGTPVAGEREAVVV